VIDDVADDYDNGDTYDYDDDNDADNDDSDGILRF
jgi:hypothetical protein